MQRHNGDLVPPSDSVSLSHSAESFLRADSTSKAPSQRDPNHQRARTRQRRLSSLSNHIIGPWTPEPQLPGHDRNGASSTPIQPSLTNSSTSSPSYLQSARTPTYDLPSARPLNGTRGRGHVKRSSSRQAVPETMRPSPIKKARTGASPPRMADMPKPGLSATGSLPPAEGPTSPLFFSNSSSSRQVARPPSFHPSDQTASMLARMHQDAGGVTTLKLPRANVHSPSPARSGSTPGSWGSSMDMSAPALTPDARSVAPGLQGLSGVDLLELLDQDNRPSFLVDLGNPANASRPGLHILFYNTALRTTHQVLHVLTVDPEDATAAADFGAFKSWIMTPFKSMDGQDLPLPPHMYGGIMWMCSTLRRRFRVISAATPLPPERVESPVPMAMTMTDEPVAIGPQEEDPSPALPVTPEAEPIDPADYFGDARRKSSNAETLGEVPAEGIRAEATQDSSQWHHPDEFTNAVLQAQPERSIFDWTRIPLTEDLPEHIRVARAVDWAATPVGPIEDWPPELRSMSNMVMGSPHPAALYWGPQFVTIFNAAHTELSGKKQELMGQPYPEAWSEIWEEIRPVFEAAWESGEATMKHDNQLFIDRHGFSEETFFSWSIVPLVGAEGEVVGLYNPCFENTRRKVTERRMLTLREVGERTATATTVRGFWPEVQKGLEYNEYDVPFSLIYSVKDDAESEVSSLHSSSMQSPQLFLEGTIGVSRSHPSAVETLDLRTSEEAFAPYMRQSMANNGSVVVLSQEEGTMPNELIEGVQWKGFKDPCRTIVVFPVVPTNVGDSVVGFIVMGVNPRRPYDDDYKLFIHLLSRQLATSMASVVLFEEEIKRGQRAAQLAALDRQQLSWQLQLKSQEANESEYKFTRMAEFAPVGMFIANSNGTINFRNDMWWQISQVPRDEDSDNAWMDSVRCEDRPVLETAWMKLLYERVTISVEFRFKCNQQNGDNTIDTWVLMSAYPEKNADGSLKSIFGCITDISSQKWAEKVQDQRREEAVELKRQQENFIDITSHEMRNPLSAILQCADQIASNISTFAAHSIKKEVETLLENCLDAANTINLCASHQKRIVDDILTLSKLDSNLLAVTPIDEQPIRVIQRALKMFESELIAHDIEFEFEVDQSFEEYGVKWAKLDPSRLRQVLINLMTNAIKFTQTREKRFIMVKVAASKDTSEIANEDVKDMHYFDRNDTQRAAAMDIDNHNEWGHGERINIHCSVEDTGPGLAEEELKILFQRFQQATPRTHVQYGGSGLGLFISRILTEMQGGQIGVSSRSGHGSKFSFYIQSRICLSPPSDYEHISPFKIARRIQSPAATTSPSSALSRHGADPAKPNPLFDVLIVEDNIVNQKVLQRQLRNCGNNTFVANHGQEALQTLQKSRFWSGQESEGMDISVILMDLEMPVMDGMTCARKIRELESQGIIVQHIPIIAVTAYARPEQIENAKAAGIDDVISKPFRIPELLPKIEELVGKYKNLSLSS